MNQMTAPHASIYNTGSLRSWFGVPSGIGWFFVVDVLMGVVAAVAYVVSSALGVENPELFRLGMENNLPTWYSSMQLFTVALALGVWAAPHVRKNAPGSWWVLAAPALFAALSLDEVAMLHERAGHLADAMASSREALEAAGLRTGLWMVVCVPLFLIALALVVRAVWPLVKDKPAIIRKTILGLVVFLGAAVGLETLANLLATGSMLLKLEGMVEEVGEMIGGTILLWAAWDLLKADRTTIKFE